MDVPKANKIYLEALDMIVKYDHAELLIHLTSKNILDDKITDFRDQVLQWSVIRAENFYKYIINHSMPTKLIHIDCPGLIYLSSNSDWLLCLSPPSNFNTEAFFFPQYILCLLNKQTVDKSLLNHDQFSIDNDDIQETCDSIHICPYSFNGPYSYTVVTNLNFDFSHIEEKHGTFTNYLFIARKKESLENVTQPIVNDSKYNYTKLSELVQNDHVIDICNNRSIL